MSSGSSLHGECNFPFGMLCLSACRMMFVKLVYACECYVVLDECDEPLLVCVT